MARKSTKPALVAAAPASSSEVPASTADVAALAYQLWLDRGCPEGSPDEDWYEAQRKLQIQTES